MKEKSEQSDEFEYHERETCMAVIMIKYVMNEIETRIYAENYVLFRIRVDIFAVLFASHVDPIQRNCVW